MKAADLREAAVPVARHAALPPAARQVVRVPPPARANGSANAVRHAGFARNSSAPPRAPVGLLLSFEGARSVPIAR